MGHRCRRGLGESRRGAHGTRDGVVGAQPAQVENNDQRPTTNDQRRTQSHWQLCRWRLELLKRAGQIAVVAAIEAYKHADRARLLLTAGHAGPQRAGCQDSLPRLVGSGSHVDGRLGLLGCGVAIVERGRAGPAVSIAQGALHDRGRHVLGSHLRDRGPCLRTERRRSVCRLRGGRRRGTRGDWRLCCRCNAHWSVPSLGWCA